MKPNYQVIVSGVNGSFHPEHPLLAGAASHGEVVILLGSNAGAALAGLPDRDAKTAVLLELGLECLGQHTGESRGVEGSNVLGFSRFRLGSGMPSNLIELVHQPNSQQAAIDAAKYVFKASGLEVAVCRDFPGRIVDRLVRPFYNAALRKLDEGLALADDIDLTIRLGLGYPEGPISLLERTGLARHFDVTQALYDCYGDPAFIPARRARVAKLRETR